VKCNCMNFKFRELTAADYHILREMFYLSIFIPEDEDPYPLSVIDLPELSIYINGFGRGGDFGFVCENDGKPVGAIWGRVFDESSKGFGFIDDKTPELGMAVLPEYRNREIGNKLLQLFLNEAKRREYRAVSLSVDKRNPAQHLYDRAGFAVVKENDVDFLMIIYLEV
jgi:[ribosomal protein S18]-alanine N-acetyltransferase